MSSAALPSAPPGPQPASSPLRPASAGGEVGDDEAGDHPALVLASLRETALVRTARELGRRVLDRGGMAVFQAVDAFRLFTRVEPDAGRDVRAS